MHGCVHVLTFVIYLENRHLKESCPIHCEQVLYKTQVERQWRDRAMRHMNSSRADGTYFTLLCPIFPSVRECVGRAKENG